MVGSHDFTDDVAGQVNNALTYQQPGSSIKPIVYTASLIGNQGNYLTPASILWDVPVTYDIGGGQTYRPTNFDNRYYGPVPLRYALQNSYNIPAVKAYVEVGNQQFSEVAQVMGLQFAEGSQLGLASALGANEVRLIDMMQAYGVLANGGLRTDLYAIERVTETGEGGEELEVVRNPRPEPVQVISPQVAYLMQNILSDDNARAQQFGTGSNLTLARLGLSTQNHIAAKTGTSNDSRDLWTMGFSRNVVVGVWLGTYDNSPTYGTTGYNSASPVWNTIFEAALRGRTPPEFQNPGGVIAQEVCRTTGTLSYDGCPERTTDLFVRDQYPPPPDDGFVQTIAIDSWTGLRANQFCDDYIVEETFADINDPSAVDWLNTSPEGQAYARQVGLPIPLQTVPLNECAQGQTLPSVSVSYPNANQVIQGQVSIRGLVQAPDFSRYELAYASVTQPDTFYSVVVSQNQVISNGSELGTWDTTQVANGVYIMRLVAISTANGQIVVDIPVTVQNTLPTPTPAIPTVAPNPTLLPSGGTPIPFENESFDGGFEALPAPTFTPLGG
jgi:membrane carboxypeptidase/penicillin-binding protein PbpC